MTRVAKRWFLPCLALGGETTKPKSLLDLGEGPATSLLIDGIKELIKEPPQNNVVKSASAPAKSTFAGADTQKP
jgi:ribosomal protein RSM22 (predicted rRNA methylase)